MPNVLNAQGLTTATQAELLSYYTTALQTIYGADINLDPDSPDGEWINILIQATLDVLDLQTQIYNSFDPDNAVGVVLDQRVTLNGIQRQGGTYTLTNVTLVLSQSVNLYGLDQSVQPVFTVADNAGNQWNLVTTQLGVGPSTVVATFQSATIGATLTVPNTITVPITIVLGVQSINNPTAALSIGINQESDAALRIRRLQSVSISSQGYLAGLLAALENINGITSAFVYENNTNTTDGNNVPGHSIWAIVAGTATSSLSTAYNPLTTYSYGQIASSSNINYISWQNNNLNNSVLNTSFWGVYNPVAEAIYDKRNAGCGMFGGTNYTITQIDGSLFTVSWDTVVAQNLYISFTATSINGVNQPNIAGIVAGLPALFDPGVNMEVNINALATAVQQIDPNCLVTLSGFSLALTQILILVGTAASGSFMISYNGNNSSAINWNDSTSTIQTKVQGVSGLGAATVTGTIAGLTLTIALGVNSALTLITVVNNSLMTSAPVAVTFQYQESYMNTLSPTAKNFQFAVASNQIVVIPMILSPTTVTVARTRTQTFTGLGGYGTLVYAIGTNVSGSSINASTGVYTAGSSTGTDIATVTDAFGNTASATISVV